VIVVKVAALLSLIAVDHRMTRGCSTGPLRTEPIVRHYFSVVALWSRFTHHPRVMPFKRPRSRTSAAISAVLAIAGLAIATVALMLHVQQRRRGDALLRADPDRVLARRALRRTALEIARPAFARQCAGCHGPRGGGDPLRNTPDLRDDEYLYGSGKPDEIEQIVLYGIRAGLSRGKNLASMPAYGRAQPYAGEPIPPLSPSAIADVTQFVLSLSGRTTDRAATARGRAIYLGAGGCYDCHGGDGHGDPGIGAPNLAAAVWLYGDGSAESIAQSITYGRAGICPAFATRITPLEARAIAIYVAYLSHDRQT
jgi:cytochrome c oxidase cbb3-type subunit 3